MTVWKHCRKRVIEENRALNVAGMATAGFSPDPGRTLTPEEISNLNLTPPEQIRDCRVRASSIFWR